MFKSTILGNVGQDPIQKAAPNGDVYYTFSLAVSTGKDQTTWVNVSVNSAQNDRLARFVSQWVKKGSALLIMGSTAVNAYINKDNIAIPNVTIFADDIRFAGRSKQEVEIVEAVTSPIKENNPGALTSDEIPF